MDRRIQQALDGELARHELTQDLAAELAETEAELGGIVEAIPERPFPDLSAAVMQRVRGSHGPGWEAPTHAGSGRWLRWLWTPRPVSWRPAYGLAMAAVLALVVLGTRAMESSEQPAPAAGPGNVRVFVQFRLDAPDATGVTLAGDFTDWRPAYVLTRSASGTWSVVVPVEPGVHEYAFVVDGARWIPDPYAPTVSDGFGGVNSRLAILTPDAPRPL